MITVTMLVLSVSGACLLAGVVVWYVMRPFRVVSVGGVDHAGTAQPAHTPTQLVDSSAIQILSERLALIEGRIPAMQQILDGYAAVTVRLGELEANLPHLADAYSKFSQMVLNQEKRANEKQRRTNNRQLTVEDAVADAGLAATATQETFQQHNERVGQRAGVLGGNGQRSAPK